MIRLWELPFQPRMINDRDPGHEGPSCKECAAYQADRLARAATGPMVTATNGRKYPSPHNGTYLFEARFSHWQCTQGKHGHI